MTERKPGEKGKTSSMEAGAKRRPEEDKEKERLAAEAELPTKIRNILVALDASEESLAALEESARLASLLEAELRGIYVEDSKILDLGGLRCAREILSLGSGERLLDEENIDLELRLQASQARRALARIAQAYHLAWSFAIARGDVTAELLAAAAAADLVAIAKRSSGPRRHMALGATARAVATQVRSVLCVEAVKRHGRPVPGVTLPVFLLFDGSPASVQAADVAQRMLTSDRNRLIVMIQAEDEESFSTLQAEVRKQLAEVPGEITFIRIGKGDTGTLLALARSALGGVMVAARSALGDGEELIGRLLESSRLGLLLVDDGDD